VEWNQLKQPYAASTLPLAKQEVLVPRNGGMIRFSDLAKILSR
jgi:hypothetical protein